MRNALLLLVAAACSVLCGCAGSTSSPAAPTPAAATQARIGWPRGDDWEPYVTTDGAGHLYAAITHVSGRHIQVQRSDDAGRTWSTPVTIDPTPTKTGQYDPWLAIDPADGRSLIATYMQDAPASAIRMVRSSDRGATWSAPVAVSGPHHGLDKDAMAARGKTIAVCFDNFFTMFAAVSNDGGSTWVQHRIFTFAHAPNQLLCSGAGIDSHGTIFFAWDTSAIKSTASKPAAEVWIERSTDNGVTWKKTHLDYGGAAYPCASCHQSLSGAFYGSQISLAIESNDAIDVLWNATPKVRDRAPQRIYFAQSTDGGATFSRRSDVSLAPAGVEHSFPTVLAGSAGGDARIAWEDDRTGAWNVYYRKSSGAGAFGAERTLSSYAPGYGYLTAKGFRFPYGDYFRLTLDDAGKLHAAWGESPAYDRRGNVWVFNEP